MTISDTEFFDLQGKVNRLIQNIGPEVLSRSLWQPIAEEHAGSRKVASRADHDHEDDVGVGSENFVLTTVSGERAWRYPYKKYINVMDAPYNAKGDNSADDTTAIHAAIADIEDAGSGMLHLPGTHKVSAPLTCSVPIIIEGTGMAGTGLHTSSGTLTMLSLTGGYSMVRDVSFIAGGAMSAGAGLSLSGTGNIVDNCRYEGGWFNCIKLSSAYDSVVRDCLIVNPQNAGIFHTSSVGDAGDNLITGNSLISALTASSYGVWWESGGGLKIVANKFNGGLNPIRASLLSGVVTTGLHIVGNNIESGTTSYAIRCDRQSGTPTVQDLHISANHIGIASGGGISIEDAGYPDFMIGPNDIGIGGTKRGINLAGAINGFVGAQKIRATSVSSAIGINNASSGSVVIAPVHSFSNISTEVVGPSQLILTDSTTALALTKAQDAATSIVITNTNAAGTSARAFYQALSAVASIVMQAHGTGRTTARWGRTISDLAEIQSTGGPVIMGTTTSAGVGIGTNSVLRDWAATPVTLTDNTITTIGTIVVPNDSYVGGHVQIFIMATNGTDTTMFTGWGWFAAVAKGGTATATFVRHGGTEDNPSTGGAAAITSPITLTAAVTGTSVALRVTADATGITPSSMKAFCRWSFNSDKTDWTFTPA